MAARKLLVARASFAAHVDGRDVFVHAGERVRADHPAVRGREAMFASVDDPDREPPARRQKRRS